MKAILRTGESEDCVAASLSGKREITVEKGKYYDFMYDSEDNFFLIVDDIIYSETSTAFDFEEPLN